MAHGLGKDVGGTERVRDGSRSDCCSQSIQEMCPRLCASMALGSCGALREAMVGRGSTQRTSCNGITFSTEALLRGAKPPQRSACVGAAVGAGLGG